ncbi:MAG: transporter substrate-binding domain-containing protein [Clostridia bacterium]|nr:transporter substrate-binding domain-containing protein [Oscillospiraceae bacterium]MBR2411599.1 transporter substrate-binding domain-containing protein [Clostridia bacterium]
MKKTLSVILAALLALGCVLMFASCGGNTEETTAPADDTTAAEDTTAAQSDLAYILDKGTLVVGVTEYKPMDYLDENNEWTGFDAEYARAVAKELGVEVEFIEIEWDNKEFEVKSKKIDCVWNGMTITDALKESMDITDPYVKNAQVVVMPKDKAADYTTVESIKDLSFAVEVESAGKGVAEENGFNYTELTYQSDAILEVHTGKADACIIDLTMADALTAEGSTYENLTKVLSLNEEEYGIGCRKGSDLCTKINEITDKLIADGTLDALAQKYELTLVK